MNWFKQRSVVTASPRNLGCVNLYVTHRETYIENPDEPGCFKKRVFWEASAHNSSYTSDLNEYLSVTGEGETRSQAIIACVEAMLDWSEGV